MLTALLKQSLVAFKAGKSYYKVEERLVPWEFKRNFTFTHHTFCKTQPSTTEQESLILKTLGPAYLNNT